MKRKQSFFEKKDQKTFIPFESDTALMEAFIAEYPDQDLPAAHLCDDLRIGGTPDG